MWNTDVWAADNKPKSISSAHRAATEIKTKTIQKTQDNKKKGSFEDVGKAMLNVTPGEWERRSMEELSVSPRSEKSLPKGIEV